MSEMEKAYQPQQYEADIYKMWEESGAFKPADDPKKPPFSIIMPPPNANGSLHTGHAMFTVEDIMIRFHRMQGNPTLWLPGADHAGIETQVVFERELAKEGKSRFDFTPQEFYQAAFDYTKSNQHHIIGQLKSLGFSADWSRLKFTLDEDILDTVHASFKQLFDDGYIYRGNRIVNWCPHCNSAFSDIEIKHREQIDPLYYIKYGPFVLATVRPETKFGDTAVAVHPDDERYQQYIGQEIEVNGLVGDFKLKVIADAHVNPEFGTGVVKVTPAHDPNDWEIGQRHNLEVKQVIGTDGRLTDLAGKYAGMKVTEARQQVAQDLEAAGLIDHIDMNYTHSVGYHDRCGTQIEPLVTEQWWLKMDQLKQPAIQAIKSGEIKVIPARFKKVLIDWLENLHDWNISRQNWFGIRIPVYYRSSADESKQPYMVFSHENEAREYYGEGNYEAETDTFDTWFSSSQWPFATLKATGDFDQFYPTSVMETGRDILFQWVSRMIIFGLYRTGQVPFKAIYLHGLVNDAKGKKMSKSKGNTINPLELTKTYGTDALRLALTIGITPGNDGTLSDKKVEGYRNFANKLWNVARFALSTAGAGFSPSPPLPQTTADGWVLDRFSRENAAITQAINDYRFSEAGERVYSLLWNDLADWYLEASKAKPNPDVLAYCLETILKLAHPFAPFVTEAIWQKVPWQSQNLITERWPEPGSEFAHEAAQFEVIMALTSQIRNISQELSLAKPVLKLKAPDLGVGEWELLKRLAQLDPQSGQSDTEPSGLRLPASSYEAYLEVGDSEIQNYRQRLESRRQEANSYLERLNRQLGNTGYTDSAPPELVEQTRLRQSDTQLLLSNLDEQIKAINKK
jgi:valyl-tRNA synthetase